MNEFIHDPVNLFVLLFCFFVFLKKTILIMHKEIDKTKWIIEWKIFKKKDENDENDEKLNMFNT